MVAWCRGLKLEALLAELSRAELLSTSAEFEQTVWRTATPPITVTVITRYDRVIS